MAIPTLASADEAPAFVDARIAEGSDYIKIIYDDGATYGLSFPTISREVLQAAIAATKARGKLAVVHIGSRQGAQDAIAAGASGLVTSLPTRLRTPAGSRRSLPPRGS